MKLVYAVALAAVTFASAGTATAGQPAPTLTVAITSDTPDPSQIGAPVTLSATITTSPATNCDPGGGIFPPGSLVFRDTSQGNATLCTVSNPLTQGETATCNASFSGPVGAHPIIAEYVGGNSVCARTPSAPEPHEVVAAATPVPTMAEWAMWGFVGLLMIGGTAVLARRSRNPV